MPELSETEVIEAANDLAELIEAQPSKHQAARDKAIRGALRKVTKLMRDRFRAQRKSVLDSHALGKWVARESDEADRTKLEQDIATALGTQIYAVPVTAEEQERYAKAVGAAIESGEEQAADMLGTAGQSTESFIAEYLKSSGFARLTGDIDKTTVERLASDLADAYESGADFDGVVQAVKDSFAMASDYRAKMIAQNELNDAWNQSVLHFGREAGGTKKSWTVDPGACVICLENVLDGDIDMEGEFASGDDAPPAHVNCNCSLLVHA